MWKTNFGEKWFWKVEGRKCFCFLNFRDARQTVGCERMIIILTSVTGSDM